MRSKELLAILTVYDSVGKKYDRFFDTRKFDDNEQDDFLMLLTGINEPRMGFTQSEFLERTPCPEPENIPPEKYRVASYSDPAILNYLPRSENISEFDNRKKEMPFGHSIKYIQFPNDVDYIVDDNLIKTFS